MTNKHRTLELQDEGTGVISRIQALLAPQAQSPASGSDSVLGKSEGIANLPLKVIRALRDPSRRARSYTSWIGNASRILVHLVV